MERNHSLNHSNMSALEMIHHQRLVQMEADLEKARQIQNELTAALDKAHKTIAEMREARTKSDDRWAYLLGNVAQERDEQVRIAASLKLELKSLRNPNTQPQQPNIQP